LTARSVGAVNTAAGANATGHHYIAGGSELREGACSTT
jgi:hypothetical protein